MFLLVRSSLQRDQSYSQLLKRKNKYKLTLVCVRHPIFSLRHVSIYTTEIHRHAVTDLHNLTTIQPLAVVLSLLLMKPLPISVKYSIHGLTGRGRLADKSDELLLNLLHGVQVVHEEHMSVAGLAGDVHQLPIVCVRKADGEDDVTWQRRKQRSKKGQVSK